MGEISPMLQLRHHTGSHTPTSGNGINLRGLWENALVSHKDCGGEEQSMAETQMRTTIRKRET